MERFSIVTATLYFGSALTGGSLPTADVQSPISGSRSSICGLKECGNRLRLTGDQQETETARCWPSWMFHS